MTLALFASGSNACGQLATGDREDSHRFAPCLFYGISRGQLPTDTEAVVQIACGSNHTLVLIESEGGVHTLWGCGDGRRGQLGPSLLVESTPVFKPIDLQTNTPSQLVRWIACGWETSFVVLSQKGESDVLVSMGGNDFGDLGIGGAEKKKPTRKPKVVDLNRVENGMFDGKRIDILSIVAGPHHVVLCVKATGDEGLVEKVMLGWGTSRHGQLGSNLRSKPFISSPQVISLEEDVLSFALGNLHTAFLHESGRCSAMGSDKKNQIQRISSLKGVKTIDCTWNGTYVMVEEDEVQKLLCNGNNSNGQLGKGEHEVTSSFVDVLFPVGSGKLKRISCGSEHVLSLLAEDDIYSGEVWGWGWNEHGNLGLGTTVDVKRPTKIWPSEGDHHGKATNIWAGCGTSWITVKREDNIEQKT